MHFIFNYVPPPPENRALYEIVRKKLVQTGHRRQYNTAHTLCLRRHTHSGNVIFIAFPRQQWFRERTSMLRIYVRCLLVKF